MELQVTVTEVLEPRSYVSKRDGKEYKQFGFVGKTGGMYPKFVKFDVLKEEAWASMGILVGTVYTVSFDASSREWSGKWYTSLNAWKVVVNSAAQSQSAAPPAAATAPASAPLPQSETKSSEEDEDLPF